MSHVLDTVSLYFALLHAILTNMNPGHGKSGFYLAASGKIAWHDIYVAIAEALARRGVISDERVDLMTDPALEKIAKAQNVSPSSVTVKIGGRCAHSSLQNPRNIYANIYLEGRLTQPRTASLWAGSRNSPLSIYLGILTRKLSLFSIPSILNTWAFGKTCNPMERESEPSKHSCTVVHIIV